MKTVRRFRMGGHAVPKCAVAERKYIAPGCVIGFLPHAFRGSPARLELAAPQAENPVHVDETPVIT